MIGPASLPPDDALIDAIDAALPQTQCTRCGFADCRGYAHAMAAGEADIDRCPPGGAEGIRRLSRLTGRPQRPLDPDRGAEGPLRLAVIDEARCIGCTLCLQACPVDCIVGASKLMHTVIEDECTGCELCLPACPVDCIDLRTVGDERTGWAAWSPARAGRARSRYVARRARIERDRREHDDRLTATAMRAVASRDPQDASGAEAATRSLVATALERARMLRTGS